MGLIKARTKQSKRPPPPAAPPVAAAAPTLDDDSSDDEPSSSDAEERTRLAGLLESARLAARGRQSVAAAADVDDDDGLATNAELVRLGDGSDDDDLDAPAQPARKKRKVNALVRPVSLADLRPSQPVASTSRAAPAPARGPQVGESQEGTLPTKRLSKKERQKSRKPTTGSKWFDMPAQAPTPELRREIQAMRLHGVLDPKRFLRGEAKRDRNKLPEFFQVGHILPTQRSASTASVGSSVRKRSFVDELVADAQARTRARKQYAEVQAKASSGGKSFYAALKARRSGGRGGGGGGKKASRK